MRLFALVFVLASSALAQPIRSLHDDQWVHTRVSLLGGVANRGLVQNVPDIATTIKAGSLTDTPSAQLLAAFFFRPWLGAQLEVRTDFSYVQRVGETKKVEQIGLKASAVATFRWQPSLLFAVEGQVGFAGGRVARLDPVAQSSIPRGLFGPVLGANVVLEPLAQLSLLVGGRFDYSLITQTTIGLTFTGQVRYGFVDLGPFNLGLGAAAEWSRIQFVTGSQVDTTETVTRLTFGPSLVGRREAPPGEKKSVGEAPSVVGKVTRTEGGAITGAKVSVGSLTVSSDDSGAFELSGLPSGPATVKATANGFKPATRDIIVTPGTPVVVTLELQTPTGPGRITGVVKSKADKPLAGAKVVMGSVTVMTSASGSYTLEPAGPGPVKVVVSLDGYAAADESVQVIPESTATLDVTLEPLAQRTKAKIRGVISSAAGPVAKATVRIVELKLKQAVKADGRFEADVAGGKYTLVIEAPKHVTQTRIVEVADGDQAIFQIELEKAR